MNEVVATVEYGLGSASQSLPSWDVLLEEFSEQELVEAVSYVKSTSNSCTNRKRLQEFIRFALQKEALIGLTLDVYKTLPASEQQNIIYTLLNSMSNKDSKYNAGILLIIPSYNILTFIYESQDIVSSLQNCIDSRYQLEHVSRLVIEICKEGLFSWDEKYLLLNTAIDCFNCGVTANLYTGASSKQSYSETRTKVSKYREQFFATIVVLCPLLEFLRLEDVSRIEAGIEEFIVELEYAITGKPSEKLLQAMESDHVIGYVFQKEIDELRWDIIAYSMEVLLALSNWELTRVYLLNSTRVQKFLKDEHEMPWMIIPYVRDLRKIIERYVLNFPKAFYDVIIY
jgi:ferredoxin-like protein FixX